MPVETIDATRIITIDYSQSLQDMIAAGKYDCVNDDITAKKFPVQGKGSKKFHTKLFDFSRYISSESGVATMQKENFTPGGHVHGLAFGATFPEEQLRNPIACLGSSAQVDGLRSVMCLGRRGAKRCLYLSYWDDGWSDRWRFLGFQEVSGP